MSTTEAKPVTFSDCTTCFYVPQTGTCIDYIHPVTGQSMHYGRTHTEMAAAYPNDRVEIWNIADIQQHQEARLISQPEPITSEAFNDALEMLPPNNWVHNGMFESFQCCEHFSGRITATYLRRGLKAWVFRDVAGMTHDAIVEKVRAYLARTAQEGGAA